MTTREEALQGLADVIAECAERTSVLTPREAAERACHPGGPSVDELTETITAIRLARQASLSAAGDASRGSSETRIAGDASRRPGRRAAEGLDDKADGIPTMMSPKTLSALLEVTTLTLQRWRAQGKGPAWHQFPGSNVIRYTRVDVLAWLAEHRIPPG